MDFSIELKRDKIDAFDGGWMMYTAYYIKPSKILF